MVPLHHVNNRNRRCRSSSESLIMKNPWLRLPADTPRILHEDRSIIEAFNARYGGNPQFRIQPQLLPEPFIGDPEARVCLLALHPGYKPEQDDHWHSIPDYQGAIRGSLNHRPANPKFPFYFLDPDLKDAPGSHWWRQAFGPLRPPQPPRCLLNDVGVATLARNLFCIELFPYHLKSLPKSRALDGLPSSRYTVHLVQRAIRANRPIVLMYAFHRWCEVVPELQKYANLFRFKNPQCNRFSPGNLGRDRYDLLVRELRSAPRLWSR